jgi:predicted transposase/invertase (TIGR01784 family)
VKTDTIFYRLFQSFPSLFFELIDHSPQEAQNYQFASVEVKQLAFRIDGIFLPTGNLPEQPIYFVEVQFQKDPQFYSRFFSEIFLYLNQTQFSNDWRGVVIYPSRNLESKKRERYRELLNSNRTSRIYLDELESPSSSLTIATVQLIIAEETTTIERGKSLIKQTKEEIEDEQTRRELLQLIETILFYKLPKLSGQEIEIMFSLSDLRQTKVYQEALEEGRQEGELKAKLESVPRLLAIGLSVEQIAQALELTVEQVRKAAQ